MVPEPRARTRLRERPTTTQSAVCRSLGGQRGEARGSKLSTWLSTQGEDLRAPVHSTSNRDATSMAPRLPSNYSVRLGSCDRRDRERTKTRPVDFCNPHFKDEHSHSVWLPACLHSKLCATGWLCAQRRSAGFGQLVLGELTGILDPPSSRTGLTSGAPSPSGVCPHAFARKLASGRSRSLPPPSR